MVVGLLRGGGVAAAEIESRIKRIARGSGE